MTCDFLIFLISRVSIFLIFMISLLVHFGLTVFSCFFSPPLKNPPPHTHTFSLCVCLCVKFVHGDICACLLESLCVSCAQRWCWTWSYRCISDFEARLFYGASSRIARAFVMRSNSGICHWLWWSKLEWVVEWIRKSFYLVLTKGILIDLFFLWEGKMYQICLQYMTDSSI